MKRRIAEVSPQSEPKESNPYEAAIFAAELGADVPTIDLHGRSVQDVDHELGAFVYRIHPPGTEALRIIHGRGEQKLRAAVIAWLKKHADDVPYFRDAHHIGQQGGVTYVALWKERP